MSIDHLCLPYMFPFISAYSYIRRIGDLGYYVILGFLDLVLSFKEGSDTILDAYMQLLGRRCGTPF